MVDHWEPMTLCVVEKERSGEVGLSTEINRVVELVLRKSNSESVSVSCMRSLRPATWHRFFAITWQGDGFLSRKGLEYHPRLGRMG